MKSCGICDDDIRLERKKLLEDLKTFSVKIGKEFTLASGQKSNIYVDVKATMLNGSCMYNLAKLLKNHATLFGWYNAVAGAPLGGMHLASLVAGYDPPTNVILVRNQVKDHGTQKLVEAPLFTVPQKVVLFEDVVTTGTSVLKTAKIIEDSGFDIRGIVAVVDRRVEKSRTLGDYGFVALVDFEELVEDLDAEKSQQVSAQTAG